VLAGSAPGGQLMITSDVENYPGFPLGIQGPELMAAFREQAERFGSHIVDVDIERVDFSSRPFHVWARGVEYTAEAVIVATGASALWLGLDSETRLRGRGVSACATCDGFFFKDKEIAVVGGGDTALEEATFLTRFASKVHLLHRRDQFRASKIMVDRAIAHPKIEIHTNTAVEEVMGTSKVDGLRLRDTESGEEREVPMEGLFIAIGYRPNTEVFRDWLDVDEKGYLVVHDETGSKIEGVFIAGDVHDHRYRQAVTAAGDGCKARSTPSAGSKPRASPKPRPHRLVGRRRRVAEKIEALSSDAVLGIILGRAGLILVGDASRCWRARDDLPLTLKRLHQSGDLRQPKAGEPTVLEARDRRLIDPARALESTLGPPVSEASPPKLDPEQPKAFNLAIGERPAFGAAQRFHGAD
jgi:thioredoxin reductase (NADPH)